MLSPNMPSETGPFFHVKLKALPYTVAAAVTVKYDVYSSILRRPGLRSNQSVMMAVAGRAISSCAKPYRRQLRARMMDVSAILPR